jgi:hypothetical protein
VLRRERFQFDAVFTGPAADSQLRTLARRRCLRALQTGRDLTALCLSCGRGPSSEPPQALQLLLGGEGGSGLLSALAGEALRTRGGLSLAAVVVRPRGGGLLDLLTAGPPCKGGARISRRPSSPRWELAGVRVLALRRPEDVDRLAGLLLARLAALPEDETSAGPGTLLLRLALASGGLLQLLGPLSTRQGLAGSDLDVFSECMAAAPHGPPPSLLRCCPLAALLLQGREQDLLAVLAVSRAPPGTPTGGRSDHKLLAEALQALRIACRHASK